MHAFILAGGFATRLWPLTEKRPKPLLPLEGKPMITWLVEKIPANVPVTVSTNATFEDAFRQWASGLKRPVELIIEDTRADDHKLGALGAIAQWVETGKIEDDLLILTGDNYLGFSMDAFLARFHGAPLLAAHDIGDLGRASAFGTVIVEASNPDRVRAFEEKPKEPKTTLVSTGCVILPKETMPTLLEFAKIKPDNLGGIFEELLRLGMPVECFTFTEPWMDIGSFRSYMDAHKSLTGDRLLPDERAIFDSSTAQGSVVIGAGSKVITSDLTDVMVFKDCVIENCTIRNCVIDDGCILKGVDLQNQMLRAGTRLKI